MTTIQGPIRADRHTKDLVKRLKPGDIALIHHVDLDATAARSLVERRVSGVVNAAPSISGRYPNGGPSVLLQAGITLLDAVGDEFFDRASQREGAPAILIDDTIRLSDGICAVGTPLTQEIVAERLAEARQNLGAELDGFARNTLEYLAEEKGLLIDPLHVPEVKTPIKGRHALVVVRGEGYKEDLRYLGDYLADVRPVLIGVDGGADALLEMGLKPDIIVGDMDSVSDQALKCGSELIVHGYTDEARGTPGLARLERLKLDSKVFQAPGTSEDVAMILADENGASLIVAVGTHFSLVEFLDKGRKGMASTFLVRLRIGTKLVDAKGISRAWSQRPRIGVAPLILMILAALFPIGVIVAYSPWWRMVAGTIKLRLGWH